MPFFLHRYMLKVLKYSLNAISLKKKNFYSQKLPILSLNCTKFLSSQLLWGLFHLFYLTVIFTNLSVPYLNLRLQVLTMTLALFKKKPRKQKTTLSIY